MKKLNHPLFILHCAVIASFLVVLGLLTPPQAAGNPAALTWSVTQYNFGSVPVGQTPSQTFTLTNTGDISSGMITVSMSGSTVFTITADGCTGKALGADESCNVTIQYPPINTNGDESILAAIGQGSSSKMALYGNSGDNLVLSPENGGGEARPIRGPVVGQYFGLFDGLSKERYREIVAAAPFDKCNLLILAFVRTFTFDRPSEGGRRIYVAQFANGREKPFELDPNDTDGDRVKLLVRMARKKNPSIKILISLGWGDNKDTERAVKTPVEFADSVRTLVQAYHLDGIDIDFEPPVDVEPAAMLTLAQEIRRSLNKIPGRPMIMTITPAETNGLDKNVLEQFTYVMPQTYDHGGNGTTARWFANQLGGYERIVYGLNSEAGSPENPATPDDPRKFAARAKRTHAAGIFAWRLDNDSAEQGFPTFANAVEMWRLMH